MGNKRLRLTPEEVNLIREKRASNLENVNDNTSLDIHLKERGIDKKDVVSVKHWQSASGEYRFSIVTKEDVGIDSELMFGKINDLVYNYAPSYNFPKIKKSKSKNLLVINPADIHIGKYSNSVETGDSYNCKIAQDRVIEGISGLLKQASGFDIDKVLFCIGNDILHVDNVYNTTTKGTPQDSDGKWWEHYEVALELYVKCIEMLRKVAPVDVVHSMSNHDYQSGFHLAHTLKSWFRKAEGVSFDISVSYRKYYKYGTNLIGIEHGDGAKMENLPLTMAQENPKDWAQTTHRYWYLHHVHHKVKHKWRDAKDFIGVTVEYMRSPSSADSWHSRKGYMGTPKAVEGFVHSKKSGQVARLTYYF